MKFKEDYREILSEEEIIKYNEVIKKANERGYVLKSDGEFTMKICKRIQVCERCGKSVSDGGGFCIATAPDKFGEEISVGYHSMCFSCEMKDVVW